MSKIPSLNLIVLEQDINIIAISMNMLRSLYFLEWDTIMERFKLTLN